MDYVWRSVLINAANLLPKVWHCFYKIRAISGVPRGDVLLVIGEKGLENVDEVSRLGDVKVQLELSVLTEERMRRGLDDRYFLRGSLRRISCPPQRTRLSCVSFASQ